MARGRPVAAAIVRRTQMRAALDDLAGNLCPWRTGGVAVGHWRLINPEATDGDAMNRRLFGIMSIRSHAEGAARDEDHLGCTFAIHRSSFRKFLVLEGACFVRVAAMDLRSIKDT